MNEAKIVHFVQNKCEPIMPFLNFISYIFYGHISLPLFNILMYFQKVNLVRMNLFLIYTEIILVSIKLIFGRKRPYKQHTDYIKGLDSKQPESKSFPSSHSAYAALFALVLYKVITPSSFLVILPIIIGLSRMALGVHYLSDVLTGYFIGFLLFKQGVYLNII
ncbi:PAP2 superfamily [seawater metagenome]|uniref:PAP2 superfamily n=1 Tax=seawater metagenome TaxID=1561972 RepID=A0A5E8CH23_9ZZZZ